MSASKRKGTAWETAIVGYLHENGVEFAERRALKGNKDCGDVAGIPGVVIEAKNEKQITLGSYVDEAEAEARNDGARIGVAWMKRRGRTSPGGGYVAMSGEMFLRLLVDAGYIPQLSPNVAADASDADATQAS